MFRRRIVKAPVVAASNLSKGTLLVPQVATVEDDDENEHNVYTGAYVPWQPTEITVQEQPVKVVQTTDPEPVAILWQDISQSAQPVEAYVLVEGIVFEDELPQPIPEAAKMLLRKTNIVVMKREIV